MSEDELLLWRAALVPYLDLFCRLNDAELAKLANTPAAAAADMRTRVAAVQRKFAERRDLLDEFSDEELASLTDVEIADIGFWRLTERRPACRPGRCGHVAVPAVASAAGDHVQPGTSPLRAEERISSVQCRGDADAIVVDGDLRAALSEVFGEVGTSSGQKSAAAFDDSVESPLGSLFDR